MVLSCLLSYIIQNRENIEHWNIIKVSKIWRGETGRFQLAFLYRYFCSNVFMVALNFSTFLEWEWSIVTFHVAV